MSTFKEYLDKQKETEIKELIVTFNNLPSKKVPRLLFEDALNSIDEGKEKVWGKGYSYRLDKRPANQGGDQLHIFNRQGKAWAYRHTGQKSEPTKYSLEPTSTVKDIVSGMFGIDKTNIQESVILKVRNESLLIEITFS